MSQARIAALAAAALLLAGCGGGTLGPKALKQEAATVQSLAAEGSFLAADAARGRSTTVFTHEHAHFLQRAASSSFRTLQASGNAGALTTLAALVRGELDTLAHSGSDAATQRRLSTDLRRAARLAATLGQRS